MYINLKIEIIKIFNLELVVSSDGKPQKPKEVAKDEKGTDSTAASNKSK